MIAIDTNAIVALWDKQPGLSSAAQSALDSAFSRGAILISAPVFAELLACPGREEAFLDTFLNDTGIKVDWDLEESVWRVAARAFQTYASRRRKHGDLGPRRILADFVIGAHALERDCELLTLDDRLYRAAFPHLRIGKV
jgi:predicted nucleic acid-binding protein